MPRVLRGTSINNVQKSNRRSIWGGLLNVSYARIYFFKVPSMAPVLDASSPVHSIRVFSNESVLHIRWLKYWSFSFSISPYNEHSGLISLRMGWLDLLSNQGTLKSLLQHHSSKASILLCSAFFIVKLTSINNYWKNHSLDQMDLCQQSDVSALACCLGWS